MSDYMPDRETVIKHFPQLSHVPMEDWHKVASFEGAHGKKFFCEEFFLGTEIPNHVVSHNDTTITLWVLDSANLGRTWVDMGDQMMEMAVATFYPLATVRK